MEFNEEIKQKLINSFIIIKEVSETLIMGFFTKFKEIISNMDALVDTGIELGKFLSVIAFYNTENIVSCANYGVGCIFSNDLDIVIKQNFRNQEEANNYLESLSDDYLLNLFNFIKSNASIYYNDNNYVIEIIEDSIFNFNNKKFTFCITGLITLFENLGNDIGNIFIEIEENKFTENQNKFFFRIKEKFDYLENLNNHLEENDITNLSYAEYNRFLSLLILFKKMFTKTSISDNSIPNRHEVAHQTRNSPYKKYDCIKLYIFLAEILELFIVEDKLSH